jgi:hypothetical protein
VNFFHPTQDTDDDQTSNSSADQNVNFLNFNMEIVMSDMKSVILGAWKESYVS